MLHHDKAFLEGVAAERRRSAQRSGGLLLEGTDLERTLRAAVDGDSRAWDQLFNWFAKKLVSVARAHRLSREDADDIAQTTWLRLLEHAREIRDPERLAGWLTTVAERESLRVIRRGSRETASEPETFLRLTSADDLDDELLAAERAASWPQTREALETALASLPERPRRLLAELYSDQEPSYADTSAKLGLPIGSIGPTLGRSLARLRRHPSLADPAIASWLSES
jgi:RNA polymerase sigma factor (sigma-70 family)